MESNFDNHSFINELDPQHHIVRKNNYIVVLSCACFAAIALAVYFYVETQSVKEQPPESSFNKSLLK